MPRNRQHIPREERKAEVLAVATELFLSHGYSGTTMADISRAAGVAPAAVYWYFPSKDDVFAAVMDRMLSREIRILDEDHADDDPMSHLVRGLNDMRVFRPLHQAMHGRLLQSEAVREAHDRFLDWIRDLVRKMVDDLDDPSVDRELVADTAVTLFEGFNVEVAPPRPGAQLMRFLLESVLGSARARDLPAPVPSD
ncbi:TetR/AcrR family transcriptional regulator [Pseudonocardia sp. EV170527-09]|uniref:TetR/AcrR family transcriptional regulator n=1 Tax=Pseudonocardia sp. EV170527-09 TaxID=2603411 RepID=UPI001F01C29E|nr:TetR/AcrR family transcriptional regulator [Pseudonocardia sp. EV170527-09]